MLTDVHFDFKLRAVHIRTCVLAFCWIAGVLLGALLAVENSGISGALAVQFAQQKVSFLLLLICQVVPFLAVWLLDSSGRYLGVYGICILRMLVFGYCAGSICSAFSSAGWLVCLLMMFTQVITSVPLLLMALKCIQGGRRTYSVLAVTGSVVLLAVLVDCFFVAPFLSSLILGL